jgi:hypothetical protein
MTHPTTTPDPVGPEDPGGPLTAALAYAARGWHVIPLRPHTKRPAFPDHDETHCTGRDPRCRTAGRHVGWQARATTDPDRITRAWSSPLPTYGIGIACGPSGLVVLDLDTPKPDLPRAVRAELTERLSRLDLPADATGADVLAVLLARWGQSLPPTYTVATPSGGRHHYFTAPVGPDGSRLRLTNTAKSLGPLIDTRAAGGQVAAPPTRAHHRRYRVTVAGPVAVLPGWLADALHPASHPTRQPATGPYVAAQNASRADAYLRAALTREADHVTRAQPGRRGSAVYIAAANLGELVAGGALTADHVRAVLTRAAAGHVGVGKFTAREAATAIESGLRKGATRPRHIRDAA